MLGLGWTEMLVIGVVALIFIGPKDLPVVMGRIGKVIGQVQRMGREFQREINKTTGLDEVRNLRTSITSPLKKTADEIRKEFNAIGADGQPKPSGALKPTDPNTESVVDAIQQQAGMAAAKKTSTELAADYGFTSKKDEPVKAARSPAAEKPAAATVAKSKKAAAKPSETAAKAAATPASKAVQKPAAKTASAPKSAAAADAPKAVAKAAPKPRAPRKKPAETAGKSE
ncbi:Sec-independent protein translocase protein TatB [Devosia sp. XJ19-1]|uniref:Sec-independent protein translocase protein TatB n=1 Tax=Devosia ureilytica TaxID=2952754 RepID=A0A9Q4FR86_9HYPH|nr:Sec-independent protein translocase protein TatB [Devosia ureilytica]MCP8882131.1 Sec-independent protein translocase protein TatB [Devosia ureilytica]MCP8885983.1 Sec-independent protein translocase protein TatB [Devosia ureilytica]